MQLLITVQVLLFKRDKDIPVDMAILVFSKAFDTVPHRRLLEKLSTYGINGPILRWIEAFLVDSVQAFKGLLWKGLGLRKIKYCQGCHRVPY